MTWIVVNDASCLIDLRKGQLLHVLLRLPYRFIVPLPIRMEELLDFTKEQVAGTEQRDHVQAGRHHHAVLDPGGLARGGLRVGVVCHGCPRG